MAVDDHRGVVGVSFNLPSQQIRYDQGSLLAHDITPSKM